MEFFQELFFTALLAILFSLIVAISIAVGGGGGSKEKNDCSNNKEKNMVVEEVKKLDKKRFKVEGSKSKKRVTFADDVVVNNVDYFEVAEEEPSMGFDFSENLSEKVGFLDNLSEGVIVRADDQLGGQKVVKESEILLYSEELIEVKSEGFEEKDWKDSRFLDKELGTEVIEQKIEAIKDDEIHVVEEKSELVGGLEGLDAGETMMSEEIGSDPSLELVKDGDEAVDCETNPSKLLDKANLDKSCVGGGLDDVFVDKELKCEVLDGQKEVEMAHNDTSICQNPEGELVGFATSDVIESKAEGLGKINELKEGLQRDKIIDDDDDWEGVESSELEKVFAEAVNFVESGGKGKDDQLANAGSDVQMQLYGLQRLALEGPCHEPQPMALKVSARAKWY